jgi:hypothetical protein
LSDLPLLAKNPVLVPLPDGEALLFYEDEFNGQGSIWMSKFSAKGPEGTPGFSAPTQIISGSDDRTPAAAATPDGSSVFLAWRRVAAGKGALWATQVSPPTLALGPLVKVVDSPGDCGKPSLSVDSSYNAWLSFSDDRARRGHPEAYVASYEASTGEWLSDAQDGMDIRLLVRDSHDSYDMPVAIREEQTGNPRLFVLMRASNTESDHELLGTYATIDPAAAETPVKAWFSFDDDDDGTILTNKARVIGVPQADATTSVPASQLHGSEADPGFKDIDPGQKSYYYFQQETAALPTSIFPESGSVDVWFKPDWGMADPDTHVLFGSALPTAVGADAISLAYVSAPASFILRIVDSNGTAHDTSVAAADVPWAAGDPIKIRASWDTKAIGISRVNSICFKDASNGLACGPDGAIYASTDGGVTWTKRTSPITYELYSVDYISTGRALACGENGTILLSDDDGATWAALSSGVTDDLFCAHYDAAAAEAWVGGAEGLILKSTDLVTWTAMPNVGRKNFYGITVMTGPAATRIVLAVGDQGVIYRSADGGTTWASVDSTSVFSLNAISREHNSAGFTTIAVGDRGTVVRTDDAGLT